MDARLGRPQDVRSIPYGTFTLEGDVLGRPWGPIFVGWVGSVEKRFSINFIKANTKLCLSLHCNAHNCYLFANRKEIFKFKAGNKNFNFPTQFCLESISNGFSATESREASLNGYMCYFSRLKFY